MSRDGEIGLNGWDDVPLPKVGRQPRAVRLQLDDFTGVLARVRAAVDASESGESSSWLGAAHPSELVLPIPGVGGYTAPTPATLPAGASLTGTEHDSVLLWRDTWERTPIRTVMNTVAAVALFSLLTYASCSRIHRRDEVPIMMTAIATGAMLLVALPIQLRSWSRSRNRPLALSADEFAGSRRPPHFVEMADKVVFIDYDRAYPAASAFWYPILVQAWHHDPPSVADVEAGPAWLEAVRPVLEEAGVDRELRFVADAIWLGELGVSPAGVLVAEQHSATSWGHDPRLLKRARARWVRDLPGETFDEIYSFLFGVEETLDDRASLTG